MTVNDMLENFEIHGALRVQRWNEETEDFDVLYDSDDHENALLVCKGYEWLQSEIVYMYPSTTENKSYIDIPQIVIEIK